MAAASFNLMHLKRMRIADRKRKCGELLNSTPPQLEACGITIFKSHVVPQLLAENERLFGHNWPKDFAEISAGLRRYKLTAQQQVYWSDRTAELVGGSIRPLQLKAWEDFVADRLSLLDSGIEVDDASTTLGSSDTEKRELVHGPSSPSTNYSTNTSELLIADIEQGSDGLAGRSGLDRAEHSSHEVGDSPALNANSDQQSTDPLDGAGSSITIDPENMAAHVRTLQTLPPGHEKDVLCEALKDVFSANGSTLFKLHAMAQAKRDGVKYAESAANIVKIWDGMNEWRKRYWRLQTLKMRSGLRQRYVTAVGHLNTNGMTPNSKAYASIVVQILDELKERQRLKSPLENQLIPSDERKVDRVGRTLATANHQRLLSSTPVLDLFSQAPTSDLEPEKIICNILESIKSHCPAHPGTRLQMRVAGVKMNYDAEAADITSIAVRLQTATTRSLTANKMHRPVRDVRDHFEWLLRPLVFINMAAFPELAGLQLPDVRKMKLGFDSQSCLGWLETRLANVRPITVKNKVETVAMIIDALRSRAKAIVSQDNVLNSSSC